MLVHPVSLEAGPFFQDTTFKQLGQRPLRGDFVEPKVSHEKAGIQDWMCHEVWNDAPGRGIFPQTGEFVAGRLSLCVHVVDKPTARS